MHQTASNLSWIEEIHSTIALSSNHELNNRPSSPPYIHCIILLHRRILGDMGSDIVTKSSGNAVQLLRERQKPSKFLLCV